MSSGVLDLATIASLIGDPARANMLCALLDGRALTAGELAYAGRIAPQTASGHLAKLSQSRLVACLQQGRFRYYRLATPQVARMLEDMLAVAATVQPRLRPPRMSPEMRVARLCYDHCAGRLGVGLADALDARGWVELDPDGGAVTAAGERFFAGFGVDVGGLRAHRRIFCKPCLDWSERRPHVAGALGAGLARRLFDLGWIERRREGRSLHITAAGREGLRRTFGVDPGAAHQGTAGALAS